MAAASAGTPVDNIAEADLQGRLDGSGKKLTPEQAAEKKKQSEAEQSLAETDYALYEALNLLKGLVIVGRK